MRLTPPRLLTVKKLVPCISCTDLKKTKLKGPLFFLEAIVFLALFFFPALFCDVAWIMTKRYVTQETSLGNSGKQT